jgi:branched-chain amino acid transport system ATP-binding protein
MGPNGAGKTTLISVISGKYKPEEGSVSFMGRDIARLSPHTVCRLGITRTHQIPQPFTHLTVHQNIAVGAMYGNGMGKSAAMAEVRKGDWRLWILSTKRTCGPVIWRP